MADPIVQHWASLDRKNRIRGIAVNCLLLPTSEAEHRGYQFERECPGPATAFDGTVCSKLGSLPTPFPLYVEAWPSSYLPAQPSAPQSLEHPAWGHSLCSICAGSETELPGGAASWNGSPLTPHRGVWPAVLY